MAKVALIGIGKIARDSHVPAIADDPDFELAATVSRSGGLDGVENHADIAALLKARPDIEAVSLTMPPVPRFEAAMAAIAAGRHVMLEKPPGATVSEVFEIERRAREAGVTAFATWHSRFAHGVAAAKAWLADRTVRSVRIDWREDVRKWHPGQEWIWEPGGLGVFDPGINALSILTEIIDAPLRVTDATLSFPENREAPIAADLTLAAPGGPEVACDFDWREEGGETWTIEVVTEDGTLSLTEGGNSLSLDGEPQSVEGPGEYPGLYRRFADLIAAGRSEIDTRPLVHVADAFLLGRRREVAPFVEEAEDAA